MAAARVGWSPRDLARRVAASLLGLLSLALSTAVRAEGPSAVLAPSPAVTCLTPAGDQRGTPVYPPQMLEGKRMAAIRAELVFAGPDQPPEVRFANVDDRQALFRDAITRWAASLRVPCMVPGGDPVTLQQEYVFTPNDGRKVVYTTLRDQADEQRRKMLACLKRPDPATIVMSDMDIRRNHQGRLVMSLRFVAPDVAPQARVLYDGGSRGFVASAAPFVDGLRMPCLTPGAQPVETLFFFDFFIKGVPRPEYVLKDLTLPQLLQAAMPPAGRSAYFDTASMRCPFDVRLAVHQPFEPNVVQELEEHVPERAALLDYIADLDLHLPIRAAADVYGSVMLVHVPCVVLDL